MNNFFSKGQRAGVSLSYAKTDLTKNSAEFFFIE